ncbi:uncharacterized protein CC84DRAFT_214738 [Paraphaeosphaeria sporulosa]|uniref:Uncharacterized protein n=1 Tax=Paraphaeosphaeria sporulosa TaxID=1460663 RepID=A0A177C4Q1_9PLEO|nr:uncharacterized protein CC84DRAFT_214738 [Paraphaeosphaeria sporulosa]OAG01707.1 hypothetical protein CC84DRAFT_214738 [Paraphaeosphaeria sporulosa]
MTTYFYHHPDGFEYSHVLPNVAPVYLATALVPGSALESYWQSMGTQATASSITPDDSQDEYGATGGDKWHETDESYYSNNSDNTLRASYFGDPFAGSGQHGMTGPNPPIFAQSDGEYFKYPFPELIRPYHTLHSLLPYLQPARLENSVFGPKLDIVEEDTDYKFAVAVPKKMLVLFCGRNIVNRFLRTLEREDNVNWQGLPVAQELRFPRHYTNHVGVKIMISWMHRACITPKKDMRPIRVPKNTFAALSLSRALTAFGLHRDASRVDHTIATKHFKRWLGFDNIVSIWNCLPKDSKYVYRMVEDLRNQLDQYASGDTKALPDADKVLEFLEQHPELLHRIHDKEYNDRQELRPFFGTEWCERAALRTQQMIAGLMDTRGDETSMPVEWGGGFNATNLRPNLRGGNN